MKNSQKRQSRCDECGAKTEELEEFDNQGWCRSCLLEHTVICADCGERAYIEEVRHVGNEPVCESCYDDNYFQCESCGNCYHNDYYGEDGYCRYCMEDRETEAYPDNGRYYSKDRRDLPVGVEIEAEGGDYDSVYYDLAGKGFGVQGDGSLEADGIEVQVPASNRGNTGNLVRRACQSLEENGFGISRRCGLHVHIEYPSRAKTIKRLLLMVYACEPVFYAVNPQSRKANTFCQPISKAFSVHEIIRTGTGEIDKLFYSRKYAGLTKAAIRRFKRVKWNNCRYFGFNLHSLFYQKTVEFRYHAGTISPGKIMRWVEFLKAILLYVRFRYSQEEVLRLIEQPMVLSKIRYLKEVLKLDESLSSYLVRRYIKFRKHYVRDSLC